jgi:hypothetical protein
MVCSLQSILFLKFGQARLGGVHHHDNGVIRGQLPASLPNVDKSDCEWNDHYQKENGLSSSNDRMIV